MRLLEKLVAKLGEHGVFCDVVNEYEEDKFAGKRIVSDQIVKLDFSEHDKKVCEEKDKRIAELEKIISDKPGKWDNTGITFAEILEMEDENEELKRKIEEMKSQIEKLKLEKMSLRTRCKPGIEKDFNKNIYGELAIVGCNEEFTDMQNKSISELEDRHQSDCIRINQLLTTIDVLTELYQKLREVRGL